MRDKIVPPNRKLSEGVPQSHRFRKSSTENPRPQSSLEPNPTFFLHRRKTGNSLEAHKSEPVSLRFSTTTKSGPTNNASSSSKSNLEIITSSATSTLSLRSKHYPNVSDWNEKVQRETHSSFEDIPPRHVADPPRPPRHGYEWVWFPEGYWAEREGPDNALRNRKSRGWFCKSPDQRSKPSSPSKGLGSGQRIPNEADVPEIKIGSNTLYGSASRASLNTAEEKADNIETQGSKIKRSLQYVSPTYPHFISPRGQPEGLYCKVKRGIKRKSVLDNPTTPALECFASKTTLLLEGTSSYFDRQQREKRERYATNRHLSPETPQTPASADSRHRRRFGLAPWHRKSSHESLLSVSSSVHRLLMGTAPAATPSPEKQRERQYGDQVGSKPEMIEISEPDQPNFLLSEARRVKTPPVYGESPSDQPREFFFDLAPPQTRASSSNASTGTNNPRWIRTKDSRVARGCWDNDNPAKTAETKGLAKEQELEVDMSLPPEHLPSSPLCPKNSLHKSKGRGICSYHGRRRSVSL